MHPTLRRYSTRLLAGMLMSSGVFGLSRATAQTPTTPEVPAGTRVSPYSATPLLPMLLGKRAAPPAASVDKAPLPERPTVDPAVSVADGSSQSTADKPAAPADAAPPVKTAEGAPTEAKPVPSFWTKVPPVTPLPRPGWFIIPPDGPGYYSLMDRLRNRYSEKPPKAPYAPLSPIMISFFDADYRYLDDPANTQHDWLDFTKRIHCGDNWMMSFGGDFRYRFMDELDSRLTGLNNQYSLLRFRTYGDFWYRDRLRAYIEFMSATPQGQTLAPLPIDKDPADFLNLFVDAKVLDAGNAPVYLRVGRQEMLYGSQRLISPLDWANTRRTFQGAKLFWHGADWDLDAFWVKPVVPNPNLLDSWDNDRNFSGAWLTYKPKKGTAADFYVLNLNQSRPEVVGRNGVRGGFDITTFGSRLAGDYDGRWLYDVEGMVQTGIRANQSVVAGAYTVGGGYRAKNCCWNPAFWAYYDYASGTANPGGPGNNTTFNQLFPFGHYYMGILDLVARQNIHDFNLQLSASPRPWLVGLIQYHTFALDSARDSLYGAAGAPIRTSPTGAAGVNVGQEIDVIVNVHCNQHSDFWFGYAHLFAGSFIQNTGNPGSPTLLYWQYSYKW